MKRLLLVILLFSTIAQAGFVDLVKDKLNSDPGVVAAIRDLQSSEINLKALDSFMIPYISFSGNINMDSNDIKSSLITPTIRWDVFGASMFASNEFDAVNYEWEGFSVGISGNVDGVIHYASDYKKKKATVLLKKYQVVNMKNSIVLEAFNDIFNWKISTLKEPIILRELEINKEKLKDMEGKDVSEEDILKKQRDILSLQKELISVESKSKESFSDKDFQEAFDLAKKIVEASCSTSLREDIEAYKLLEEAYAEEKRWMILEDLPQVSFSVNYAENPPGNADNWNISLSFVWSIWDRGEKENQKLLTVSNERYYHLKYENALNNLEDTLENIEHQIKMKEIDLKTAEINLKISNIELEKVKKAHEHGFVTADDLELYQLSLKENQINVLKATLDLLILKLQYLSTCGVDLEKLLEVNQ